MGSMGAGEAGGVSGGVGELMAIFFGSMRAGVWGVVARLFATGCCSVRH